MTQGSAGIEELKSKIGIEWEVGVYEIEKGMIQRFVQAIDDPNPLWQSEENARKTKHEGTIAPLTFVVTLGVEQIHQILGEAPSETRLHGGTELECYQPVRAGDIVTVTVKIADIRQREGKMGKMAFMTFEITYKNQRQELVARCRQMVISY